MGEREGLLAGRVALVSGIGPGLGRDAARALADHGADLVLAARRTDQLEAVAKEVEARGQRCVWRATDVTDSASCAALVEAACSSLGRVDILVNNAYRGGTGIPFLPSFVEDPASWRASMEVNLWGSLTMTAAVLPGMVERGDGRIVNVASMAVRDIQPGQGPYATSKAALISATKTLARELGPSGIRVNAIVPGYIDGPAVTGFVERQASERGVPVGTITEELAARTALGYVPDGNEIAGTIVWLASDLARPVTGQAIDVNAGWWM